MMGSDTVVRPSITGGERKDPDGIWIIDDNDQFCDALASYINQITETSRTVCFTSAEESISMLETGRKPPEVIFLDVDMPGMNGLDAIPLFRQKAPHAKVFILTGTESSNRRRVALERGAADYLLKLDLSKEVLLRAIG